MSSMQHLHKDPSRKEPGQLLSQEQELPSPSPSQPEAWGQPGAQSSSQQALESQDWVCEPQQSRRPGRHWSLSINERRQRILQGCTEKQDPTGVSAHCPDVLQTVAQLVSQDVDKDVLIPHPRRSIESTHSFLDRSTPFSRNATSAAEASRWPPS